MKPIAASISIARRVPAGMTVRSSQEVHQPTASTTPEHEEAPTKLHFVRAKEISVEPINVILTHAQRSGALGKLLNYPV